MHYKYTKYSLFPSSPRSTTLVMDKYDFDNDQDFLSGLYAITQNPSPELVQSAKEFYYKTKLTPSFKDVVDAISSGNADTLPHTDAIPSTVIPGHAAASSTPQPKKPWD